MPPQTFRSIPWEEFHRDARALCQDLTHTRTASRILAIARGGLIPAGIIARELDLREIQVVCVKSYVTGTGSTQANQRGAVQILSPLPEGDGSGWLVVDDLADTGATIQAIRTHLPNAAYAAVYTKPEGKGSLDHFVVEVPQTSWIHFPWDLEPMYAQPISEKPINTP